MIPTSPIRYGVEINYFGREYGGEHWYATAWRYDPTDTILTDVTQTRKMVTYLISAEQAGYLNQADGVSQNPGGFRWRSGMVCNRFFLRTYAIERAVEVILEKWGHDGPVEDGPMYDSENPEVPGI